MFFTSEFFWPPISDAKTTHAAMSPDGSPALGAAEKLFLAFLLSARQMCSART